MACSEILISYVKKLGHPLREIRERALQLIIAKLQLGWELEDEFSGTRELLDSLLAWFHVQEPTLQKEALYLLLTTLRVWHPLREIRERALQLIIAKLQLGWELEDEFSGTRELLDSLLAWFHVQEPTLQKEALYLLLTTLRTKTGAYIIREKGITDIVSQLNSLKRKIDEDARDMFDDLVETLQFMNSVQSQENITVPQLHLPSISSSDSEIASKNGYFQGSSRASSASNEDSNSCHIINNQSPEGITILLFPWAYLCSSDAKTMVLIENALTVLKSTRRSCRFIRDVFLRDFPAEIFLNRPNITQSLVNMVNGNNGSKIAEALHVLLCITISLCARIKQMSSLDLVHETQKVIDTLILEDQINMELQEFSSEGGIKSIGMPTDSLEVLKQLPAPLFALDTMHTVLSVMARNIVLIEPNKETLDMEELNLCISLFEQLIKLLVMCVGEQFWTVDHKTKTHRDIAHKSCMVMRLLGDILNKYRSSFNENSSRKHHHAAWLRLIPCAKSLAIWSRESAMAPKALVAPLQVAQLDQAFNLFYPSVGSEISHVLQGKRVSIDKEYKAKYKELQKLFKSMEEAVRFMKNDNNFRNTKPVLICIKNAIPVLNLYFSENFLKNIGEVLFDNIKKWDMDATDWSLANSICVSLLAHNLDNVRLKSYLMLLDLVKNSLICEDNPDDSEKCLKYVCDVGILTEICCHGLSDKNSEVLTAASELMVYLLRGRMLLSERCWWQLLSSLMAVMPLLHVYANIDTNIGQAIVKSLEVEIADCMGMPLTEVYFGLVRLLFLKCPVVKMDAAHSLCHLLDDEKYLPPKETLRADVLVSALNRLQPEDFNVQDTKGSPNSSQTMSLSQILDVLKQDLTLTEDSAAIEPSCSNSASPTLEPALRRATLQQLAVLLMQTGLHDAFVELDGVHIVAILLRMSLLVEDYLAFPECAISCVSILNSICFTNRHALSKYSDLPALLLRVILIFPSNESTVTMCAQVLAVLAWAGFIVHQLDKERNREFALPYSVLERVQLPFIVESYWSTSPNAAHSSVAWLQSGEEWRQAIRIRWAATWRGRDAPLPPGPLALRPPPAPPGPLALRPSPRDQLAARTTSVLHSCGRLLLALQNATDHNNFTNDIALLECYTHLIPASNTETADLIALPWATTMSRFLTAPPASPRDIVLLTKLLKYIIVYMDNVPAEGNSMSWIKECFLESDTNMISLLSREQLYPQQSTQDDIEVAQLKIHIVKVLQRCVTLVEFDSNVDRAKLESLLKILLACLEKVDLKNFHALGYLNELMRCIRYIVNSPSCHLSEDNLVSFLHLLTRTLSGCAAGGGRKGQGCRLDALLAILAIVDELHQQQVPAERWSGACVVEWVARCGAAPLAALRAAAARLMAALTTHAALRTQLATAVETESLSRYSLDIICNNREANIVRAAASNMLASLTARVCAQNETPEIELLRELSEYDFANVCLEIFVDFCTERDYHNVVEPNISLSILERRSQLEVSSQKNSDFRLSPSQTCMAVRPPPTAALVVALSDVLYNVVGYAKCPVQGWNELGLFRMMFKCLSWSSGDACQLNALRFSVCRALAKVAESHKKVCQTLANTKDCLHNLLAMLTPMDEEEVQSQECGESQAQMLILIGTLLSNRAASDSAWQELRERFSKQFFNLLLQCAEIDNGELLEAALYCLTQLALSIPNKKPQIPKAEMFKLDLLNNVKSPYFVGSPKERLGSGEGFDTIDCQPEYLIEEICKVLMDKYKNLGLEKRRYQSEPEDTWSRLCSALAALFAVSGRARDYAVHRQFPKTLLVSLQGLRDHLSLVGKTAEVIRNANHNPVLRSLNWLLIVMSSLMTNCPASKRSFAENGIAVSLNRLWPWCMMGDSLRFNVVHLLVIFTNDCRKAWSSMSQCVCGRTLVGEVSALCSRHAALMQRTRPPPPAPSPDLMFAQAQTVLMHVLPDHHCRSNVIKSGVLNCVNKLILTWRRNRPGDTTAAAWCQFAEALARYPDGAASLLELRAVLTAVPLRCQVMPAIAHIAHHHRTGFLQSNELIGLVSDTLLCGDTAEVIAASRAAWALAANNHKAKLQLRSAGIPGAVASALERFQRLKREPHVERAIQLLTYTHTVLQTS